MVIKDLPNCFELLLVSCKTADNKMLLGQKFSDNIRHISHGLLPTLMGFHLQ